MQTGRQLLLTLLLAGVSGCLEDSTGPQGTELYILARIGTRPLPTYLWAPTPNQLTLADSLVVPLRSIRERGSFVVQRVQVGQNLPAPPYKFAGSYNATVESKSLVVDNCPIGALCLASLVYAPFILSIVGDSLVEVVPNGAGWEPRVYGLAKRSGRTR